MNNEPVAWMDANDKTIISNEKKWANDIPLYTHPAKTLTDEEIEDITKRWFNCHPEENLTTEFAMPLYSVVNLCKAILKKAQEK